MDFLFLRAIAPPLHRIVVQIQSRRLRAVVASYASVVQMGKSAQMPCADAPLEMSLVPIEAFLINAAQGNQNLG